MDLKQSLMELRESLQWKPDMVITNYEGERAWLRECYDESGKRIGITDCCLVEEPCDWHKAMEGVSATEQRSS